MDLKSIARQAVKAAVEGVEVVEVHLLKELDIVNKYVVRTRTFREFTVTINTTDGCGIVEETTVLLHETFTTNENGVVQLGTG